MDGPHDGLVLRQTGDIERPEHDRWEIGHYRDGVWRCVAVATSEEAGRWLVATVDFMERAVASTADYLAAVAALARTDDPA